MVPFGNLATYSACALAQTCPTMLWIPLVIHVWSKPAIVY